LVRSSRLPPVFRSSMVPRFVTLHSICSPACSWYSRRISSRIVTWPLLVILDTATFVTGHLLTSGKVRGSAPGVNARERCARLTAARERVERAGSAPHRPPGCSPRLHLVVRAGRTFAESKRVLAFTVRVRGRDHDAPAEEIDTRAETAITPLRHPATHDHARVPPRTDQVLVGEDKVSGHPSDTGRIEVNPIPGAIHCRGGWRKQIGRDLLLLAAELHGDLGFAPDSVRRSDSGLLSGRGTGAL